MKRIIIAITLLMVPLALSAQTKSFREFSGKYSGRDGYTMIEMSGEMFKTIGGNVTVKSDDTDISSLLKQIKNMVIIISENPSSGFAEDVQSMIKSGGYTSMAVISEGEQTSKFYVIQKNGKTSEFLMTVLGAGDNVIMSITGENLDVSQITQFARKTTGAD